MNLRNLKPMVEAILMAADSPVSIDRLIKLLDDENSNLPTKKEVCKIVEDLREDYSGHGVELIEVASGYRFRARADYGDRIVRLWEERRPRYSRALLETLAIIAYRQPITRGEIEHIRGVAVSTSIMRSLLEREWVRVVGHRDVPGHPGLYATTKQFLDYFGMKSLEEMPTLAQLNDVDDINADLFADLGTNDEKPAAPGLVEAKAVDGATVEIKSITAAHPGGEVETSEDDGREEEEEAVVDEVEPSAAAR